MKSEGMKVDKLGHSLKKKPKRQSNESARHMSDLNHKAQPVGQRRSSKLQVNQDKGYCPPKPLLKLPRKNKVKTKSRRLRTLQWMPTQWAWPLGQKHPSLGLAHLVQQRKNGIGLPSRKRSTMKGLQGRHDMTHNKCIMGLRPVHQNKIMGNDMKATGDPQTTIMTATGMI